jgi:hypothetical protein
MVHRAYTPTRTLLISVDADDAVLGTDAVLRKRAVGRWLHQIALVPHVQRLLHTTVIIEY